MDARCNCASLQGLTALSHLIGTRPSRPSVTDDIAEGVTILKPGGRGDCRGDKQRTVRTVHFQEVLGHFTVRQLERVYGKNVVWTEYERLAQEPLI